MSQRFFMTHGAILDPFSIAVSGLLRREPGKVLASVLAQEMPWLHGESRFKQAFTNACHFAESMTIIGPVAALDFESPNLHIGQDNFLHPNTQWPISPTLPGNENFLIALDRFRTEHGMATIETDKWWVKTENMSNDRVPCLPMLPDLQLRKSVDDHLYLEFMRELYSQTYGHSMSGFWLPSYQYRRSVHAAPVVKGQPIAALMAIVFTFKKPPQQNELTNLGMWPPMVFFIPVLTPSFPEMTDVGSFDVDENIFVKACNMQPAVASLKLLNHDKDFILPFGQPYVLSRVASKGKAPDILRSLSDVFRSLWSSKAQYSALSVEVEGWDRTGRGSGALGLDPIGMGRRIRGHNRFLNRYAWEDIRLVAERRCDSGGIETKEILPEVTPYRYRTLFSRQLYDSRLDREWRTMFVCPSYLRVDDSFTGWLPLAMTLHRHLIGGAQDPSDFLNGRVVGGKVFGSTVVDKFEKACGVPEALNKHSGDLAVSKVPVELDFDPEGTPKMFGLSWDYDFMMHSDWKSKDIDDQIPLMMGATKKLRKFAFMDQLAGATPKGLTTTFRAVGKTEGDEVVGTKDDYDVLSLFDDEEMM